MLYIGSYENSQCEPDRKSASILYFVGSTDKTLHGYGIRDQVAHDSSGTVVMATGTVYILLKRMLSRGWVHRVDADDRPKVTVRYEITRSGELVLESEIRRMREALENARLRLVASRK